MTKKTKLIASRKPARASAYTNATQRKGAHLPPFVEVDIVEEPSRGTQVKTALTTIFSALPEHHYSEAFNALKAHWRNGMESGFTKGFTAGWLEKCHQTGEYRSLPRYTPDLDECTPPAWTDVARGASVLDLVTCVLSLQADSQKRDERGHNGLIALQWDALNRIYATAQAEGETKGKRSAECLFALIAVGQETLSE